MRWKAAGVFGLLLSLVRLLASSPGPGLKIEVHIYDYSGVSADVVTRAEQETARIYGRVGVAVEWRNCARTAKEAAQNPSCEVLPGSDTRLTLRLLSNAMAQKLHRDSNVHGLALVPENRGFGEEAYVFADHARDLAVDKETQALLLGDLIAHELGHLLLGEGRHSPDGGIMHVPWGEKELGQARQGVLLFGPAETERIREQLLARGLAAGPTPAQAPTWEQLTASGTELHAKGQYAEAEGAFRQALEKAEETADPRRIARSLNDLAVEIHIRGDIAHADEMFRRAVAIWETLPEPGSLVAGLANLASIYSEEARYDRAEPLSRRALEIQSQISGPGDLKVASMLDRLGDIQFGLGNYADAETTFRKALSVREKVLSPTDPQLAETLIGLGSVCATLARFREAEGLYQRAILIRERALGNQHPDTTRALNQLARLYFLERQYGKAEQLWTRVIHALEAALGPEHPEIGAASNNLAAAYVNESRFSEAETQVSRALSICEKSFGPEHPCVAASLTHLAAIRRKEHQYGEAESLFQRALIIEEKALGPEHSEVFKTLSNLGTAYYIDGRYKDAEPILLRALKVGEQSLGAAHPEVIITLADYAALLRKLNRKGEARKLEARVRDLRATSARDNPASSEVDWRDLRRPAN